MYLDFFKIKRPPFQLTPDPDFIELLEPHRDALIGIAKLVTQRRGFGVLTGAVGTGKTTVLNALLWWFRQARATVSSAFLVNPLLTRDELLEAVLDEFEIPCRETSKPKRLAALHEHFLKVNQQNATCTLIVDEAHLLSVDLLEEIRLLSNMDSAKDKLLQVVLCGQPELAQVLLHPQLKALRQRLAFVAQLRPLTAREFTSYVHQRLRSGGLAGPFPFTADALSAIYGHTRGVPRLINLLCDSSLQVGFEKRRPQIGLELIGEAASRLVVLDSGSSNGDRGARSAVSPAAQERVVAAVGLRPSRVQGGPHE